MSFNYPTIVLSDTQSIEFCKMQECHVMQISMIEKECFEQSWSYNLFYNELFDQSKHYFVACCNERVIGYGGFAQILDEAHIMNIAVKGLYRNKGIGQAILELIIEDAIHLKIKAITLEVREDNKSAIALYEKNGFKCSGIRKKYYNNTHNALIYWKELLD